MKAANLAAALGAIAAMGMAAPGEPVISIGAPAKKKPVKDRSKAKAARKQNRKRRAR